MGLELLIMSRMNPSRRLCNWKGVSHWISEIGRDRLENLNVGMLMAYLSVHLDVIENCLNFMAATSIFKLDDSTSQPQAFSDLEVRSLLRMCSVHVTANSMLCPA
jgi:hypothetical protein